MRPHHLGDLFVFARRIRAALTPVGAVPPTEAERADERLYAERRCFACLEPVTEERGVTWMLGKTAGHRFLFHATCSKRVQGEHPNATLLEVLAAVRAMRPEVG